MNLYNTSIALFVNLSNGHPVYIILPIKYDQVELAQNV